MANCSKCGFRLPEGAIFCPNCGAPVERIVEKHAISSESIEEPIRLGLIGSVLSISIMLLLSPLEQEVNLYFLPSFISALIVTYFSKIKSLRGAIIIAMTTYLFTDAIGASLTLGMLYAEQRTLASLYGSYIPSLVDVLMYSISPVTAIIAGYIGFRLSPKKREEPLRVYVREGGFGPTLFHNIKISLKKFKYALAGSYTS
ncbi:MAG: zinc-ribbon domain-containing protein [Candidatus Bathyarchaeia archaeon]